MSFAIAARWIRFGVELAFDLVTGKLEREPPVPSRGLSFRDVEIQARASRNAGHESPPPATIPKTR